ESLQGEAPRLELSLQELPDRMSPTLTPSPGRPGVTRLSKHRLVRRLGVPRAAVRDRRKALPRELPALVLPAHRQAWRELPPNELPARHPKGPLLWAPPTVGTMLPTRPTNP